jgi:hypothetical protein
MCVCGGAGGTIKAHQQMRAVGEIYGRAIRERERERVQLDVEGEINKARVECDCSLFVAAAFVCGLSLESRVRVLNLTVY